jgi:IS5 family transposase
MMLRFRQLLNTENLLEALLEQINHHLEQNSIIVSLGTLSWHCPIFNRM